MPHSRYCVHSGANSFESRSNEHKGVEYPVPWKDYGPSENSWEPTEIILDTMLLHNIYTPRENGNDKVVALFISPSQREILITWIYIRAWQKT